MTTAIATAPVAETPRAIEFLDGLFADIPLPHVSFQLWDGTLWPDERPRSATLVLKHPGSLAAIFGAEDENALAEAFLRDDFDVTGKLESALELAEALMERVSSDWRRKARGYFRLRQLNAAVEPSWRRRPTLSFGGRHSRARDRQAISFHYDVSNEFFQQWLDARMLYSCAYFERPDDDLNTAQTAKLHHLCRKLRLQPRQRVLDIGCGWGGFAIFAAREYGACVTGVTLSERQASLASVRVAQAGLTGEVSIELRDYRDIADPEGFDAIVSIGMAEHVGRKNFPEYFGKVASLLKPGGVFLNHAIGEGVHPRPSRGPSFIQRHVFPDSDIPPIPVTLAAGERAGFEVRDVENLREHYAQTLRHWVSRLEENHERARTSVDEATYRVWRLYMAASARGFDRGHLAIYQTLFSKPDAHGCSHLPLTRRDWYPDSRTSPAQVIAPSSSDSVSRRRL